MSEFKRELHMNDDVEDGGKFGSLSTVSTEENASNDEDVICLTEYHLHKYDSNFETPSFHIKREQLETDDKLERTGNRSFYAESCRKFEFTSNALPEVPTDDDVIYIGEQLPHQHQINKNSLYVDGKFLHSSSSSVTSRKETCCKCKQVSNLNEERMGDDPKLYSHYEDQSVSSNRDKAINSILPDLSDVNGTKEQFLKNSENSLFKLSYSDGNKKQSSLNKTYPKFGKYFMQKDLLATDCERQNIPSTEKQSDIYFQTSTSDFNNTYRPVNNSHPKKQGNIKENTHEGNVYKTHVTHSETLCSDSGASFQKGTIKHLPIDDNVNITAIAKELQKLIALSAKSNNSKMTHGNLDSNENRNTNADSFMNQCDIKSSMLLPSSFNLKQEFCKCYSKTGANQAHSFREGNQFSISQCNTDYMPNTFSKHDIKANVTVNDGERNTLAHRFTHCCGCRAIQGNIEDTLELGRKISTELPSGNSKNAINPSNGIQKSIQNKSLLRNESLNTAGCTSNSNLSSKYVSNDIISSMDFTENVSVISSESQIVKGRLYNQTPSEEVFAHTSTIRNIPYILLILEPKNATEKSQTSGSELDSPDSTCIPIENMLPKFPTVENHSAKIPANEDLTLMLRSSCSKSSLLRQKLNSDETNQSVITDPNGSTEVKTIRGYSEMNNPSIFSNVNPVKVPHKCFCQILNENVSEEAKNLNGFQNNHATFVHSAEAVKDTDIEISKMDHEISLVPCTSHQKNKTENYMQRANLKFEKTLPIVSIRTEESICDSEENSLQNQLSHHSNNSKKTPRKLPTSNLARNPKTLKNSRMKFAEHEQNEFSMNLCLSEEVDNVSDGKSSPKMCDQHLLAAEKADTDPTTFTVEHQNKILNSSIVSDTTLLTPDSEISCALPSAEVTVMKAHPNHETPDITHTSFLDNPNSGGRHVQDLNLMSHNASNIGTKLTDIETTIQNIEANNSGYSRTILLKNRYETASEIMSESHNLKKEEMDLNALRNKFTADYVVGETNKENQQESKMMPIISISESSRQLKLSQIYNEDSCLKLNNTVCSKDYGVEDKIHGDNRNSIRNLYSDNEVNFKKTSKEHNPKRIKLESSENIRSVLKQIPPENSITEENFNQESSKSVGFVQNSADGSIADNCAKFTTGHEHQDNRTRTSCDYDLEHLDHASTRLSEDSIGSIFNVSKETEGRIPTKEELKRIISNALSQSWNLNINEISNSNLSDGHISNNGMKLSKVETSTETGAKETGSAICTMESFQEMRQSDFHFLNVGTQPFNEMKQINSAEQCNDSMLSQTIAKNVRTNDNVKESEKILMSNTISHDYKSNKSCMANTKLKLGKIYSDVNKNVGDEKCKKTEGSISLQNVSFHNATGIDYTTRKRYHSDIIENSRKSPKPLLGKYKNISSRDPRIKKSNIFKNAFYEFDYSNKVLNKPHVAKGECGSVPSQVTPSLTLQLPTSHVNTSNDNYIWDKTSTNPQISERYPTVHEVQESLNSKQKQYTLENKVEIMKYDDRYCENPLARIVASDDFQTQKVDNFSPSKVLKTNVGEKIIKTNDLLFLVLEWNANWLHIQGKKEKFPPICYGCKPVKDIYKCELEYYNTYLPLHLLSIWIQISDSWKKCPKVYNCVYECQKQNSNFKNVTLSTVMNTDVTQWPKRNDFLLIRATKPDNCAKIMFGCVHNVTHGDYVSPKNGKDLNLKTIRFTFLCTQTMDIPISSIQVQILCNIRTALIKNDALLCKNYAVKDIILNPKINSSRIKVIRLQPKQDYAYANDLRKLRYDIVNSLLCSEIRIILVDITSPYNLRLFITHVAYGLIRKHSPVLICVRNEESFTKLAANLKQYNLLLAVRASEIVITNEMKKLTVEKRLEVQSVKEIFQTCPIILTLLSKIFLSKLANALSGQKSTCIIDEAHLCTETDTALPLYYGMKRLVLLGKHESQNMHKILKSFGYDKSLFSRLFKVK